MLILTSDEGGQFFSKLFLFLASDVFFNFFNISQIFTRWLGSFHRIIPWKLGRKLTEILCR